MSTLMIAIKVPRTWSGLGPFLTFQDVQSVIDRSVDQFYHHFSTTFANNISGVFECETPRLKI